jgi:hypothetical protein
LAWTVTFVLGVIGVVKGRNMGVSMSFGKKTPAEKEVDMHQGV